MEEVREDARDRLRRWERDNHLKTVRIAVVFVALAMHK